MTYDPNNVFAKVLRGEIPCHKIYEDEDTLAFLDIMPRAEGHALVITKEKARDLFDVSPEALAKLMAVVQKLAPADQGGSGADGVLIAQFNGAAAGQTVFHLHVHIIPRKEGDELKPHAGKMADQAQLAATAEQKIRNGIEPVVMVERRLALSLAGAEHHLEQRPLPRLAGRSCSYEISASRAAPWARSLSSRHGARQPAGPGRLGARFPWPSAPLWALRCRQRRPQDQSHPGRNPPAQDRQARGLDRRIGLEILEAKLFLAVLLLDQHAHDAAVFQRAEQDLLGERLLDVLLDHPRQGTRAELLVVAALGEPAHWPPASARW